MSHQSLPIDFPNGTFYFPITVNDLSIGAWIAAITGRGDASSMLYINQLTISSIWTTAYTVGLKTQAGAQIVPDFTVDTGRQVVFPGIRTPGLMVTSSANRDANLVISMTYQLL